MTEVKFTIYGDESSEYLAEKEEHLQMLLNWFKKHHPSVEVIEAEQGKPTADIHTAYNWWLKITTNTGECFRVFQPYMNFEIYPVECQKL